MKLFIINVKQKMGMVFKPFPSCALDGTEFESFFKGFSYHV